MENTAMTGKYMPGTYAGKKADVEALVGYYAREWENRVLSHKKEAEAAKAAQELLPSITFSRKIGVGALAEQKMQRF